MTGELRTSVVIDYQNLHLTGHGLFEATKHLPKHETLVDPLLFANVLLGARNKGQREGFPAAVLGPVLVFRGEPSPEHDPDGYARNWYDNEWAYSTRLVDLTEYVAARF